MKNEIILRTEENGIAEVIHLYDFEHLDHYYCDSINMPCYRILCGNRFYYYPKETTQIIEIKIHNN